MKFVILYIAKYVKSVNFNEAHIAKHLLHLTKTFVVKLLQIVVSDVSPKRVLARLRLIELIINFPKLNLTKKTNLWRHKSIWVLLSLESRFEMDTTFGTLKNRI